MRHILYLSLVFSLLAFHTGCSWFSKSTSKDKEELEATAPRVAQTVPIAKSSKKEPGSLWSEDSKWNSIYSASAARMPGDVITIKVNEPFKQRIASTMNQNRKPDEPKVVVDGTGDKPAENKAESKGDKKEENRDVASAQSSGGNANKDDTKTVDATILEVTPNGYYRVGLNRAFKIGKDDPFVTVEGSIREKEISTDDTVSSDALLNLKIENFDEKKNKQALKDQNAAAAQAAGTPAPETKGKKEAKK